MRQLLETSDQSYALSVRIALDAADIPYLRDSADFGTAGYASVARIVLIDDDDFEQAKAVVNGLQQTPVQAAEAQGDNLFIQLARATFFFLVARAVWLWIATVVQQAWAAWKG